MDGCGKGVCCGYAGGAEVLIAVGGGLTRLAIEGDARFTCGDACAECEPFDGTVGGGCGRVGSTVEPRMGS